MVSVFNPVLFIESQKMIIVILFLGLFLRLFQINQSFWLDEAITAMTIQKYSLISLVTEFAQLDLHPPGHYLLLWIWSQLFGVSEISLRTPSVLFGVASIYLLYRLGRLLFSKKVGQCAALFLAVNPLAIYYSQEARMYSMVMFAVLLNMWFFTQLIQDKKPRVWLYVGSVLLLLITDYLGASLFFVQGLMLILFYSRPLLWTWLKIMFISGIIWIPGGILFLQQLQSGVQAINSLPQWGEVIGSSDIKALVLTFVKFIFGRVTIFDKTLYAIAVLGAGLLYGLIVVKSWGTSARKPLYLTLMWLLVPVVLIWGISFIVPLYSYFRMIFVLPALLLLVAVGVDQFSSKVQKGVVLLLILISAGGLFLYISVPRNQREDWKGAVSFIEKRLTDRAIILQESDGVFAPFEYYQKNNSARGALKIIPARSTDDLLVQQLTEGKDTVYLFDYLVDITDHSRLVKAELERLKFANTITHDFHGVGFVYEYHRQN